MKNNTKKKIGPMVLSGLMVGPILGSGIIILPPVVFSIGGNWAFPAWCFILVLGFFFARIFGHLTVMFPGDAGVADAIEHAFGSNIKKLTAYYLIGAVLFGPVAVMLTAARYLGTSLNPALTALPIMLISSFMLLKETATIGKASLILSTLAAIVLFSGSSTTLVTSSISSPSFILSEFSASQFGYLMLLLFWTIVGWEVVGNYSGDVKNPEKDIPKAIHFSLAAIGIITLCVASALQVAAHQSSDTVSDLTIIIAPLFGGLSTYIMAFLVCSLCVTTYLMFVGGVARLICHLAELKNLPVFFSKRAANGAPVSAVLFLTSFYCLVLLAVYSNILDIVKLIALADGFFLANALIGLFAAVKLIKKQSLKIAAIFLSIAFLAILTHASLPVLIIIGIMALLAFVYNNDN